MDDLISRKALSKILTDKWIDAEWDISLADVLDIIKQLPTVAIPHDGEYFRKKDVMGCIGQTSLHFELARKLRKLPTVIIPSAEQCEDAISREEAKQFLYERIDRLNDDELYDIFSRIIDDMYNELSSVTPKP